MTTTTSPPLRMAAALLAALAAASGAFAAVSVATNQTWDEVWDDTGRAQPATSLGSAAFGGTFDSSVAGRGASAAGGVDSVFRSSRRSAEAPLDTTPFVGVILYVR